MTTSKRTAVVVDQLLVGVSLQPTRTRVLPKRIVERLKAARNAGRSYRAIEASMAKTLGITPKNGTAAMRLCRVAGLA